jgi:hypothetical protein
LKTLINANRWQLATARIGLGILKMEPEFRQLSDRERGLLEKLLEVSFPGRDELRTQLSSVTAKQIEEDGTLELRCDSGLPSPRKQTLAWEGMWKDADGGDGTVMLHVGQNGFMNMLEIIKYGFTSIINPPCARDLLFLPPEGRGQKPER